MKQFINHIKNKWLFFAGYVIICMVALFMLLQYGKAQSFLLLNQFHPHWLDTFFIYFTFLGDGLTAIFICLVYFFLLKKRKSGITLLAAYISSGLLAQLVKHFVHAPRPRSYFLPEQYNFFIEDITHTANNSFPSGHAATAFAMATTIVMLSHNKRLQIPLLLLASVVAYSRVYLAQHFLNDILVGSFAGVLCAIICVAVFHPFDEKRFYRQRREDEEQKNGA